MNCATAGLIALIACLGDPDPGIRDKIAFERISATLRSGDVDRATLSDLRTRLLGLVAAADPLGVQRPFAILALAEVARTDRLKPWMTDAERQTLVEASAQYLSSITDYRAFDNKEGFRHGVAHGADLAMQLALNPAVGKASLDRLLAGIAAQVAPNAGVAYWAGEPDRLARAVLVTAQRNLLAPDDWKAWFATVMDPKPLVAWNTAFNSELGIKKRHNARAFLLSLLATAGTSEDPGIKQLIMPVRDALKLVP